MPVPEPFAVPPIRVLWLIKGLGPGGAEQLLLSSAHVADHERFEYSVAFLRGDKTHLVGALEAEGVSARRIPLGPARIGWIWHLRKLMTDHDIVHAHSPLLAGIARLVKWTLPRARRPLTVSTEHNVWGNFSRPTRFLNAATVSLDERRWAVSNEVQRSMWGNLGRRAEVLVHGIVHDGTRPDAGTRERVRASLRLAPQDVVAITVANLRREKDYPNLLLAAKQALDGNPLLHVLAVGQGPLEEEVRRIHDDLGLGDRVQLLGYRTDVKDLLQAADVFILASAFEGLPVSIMEAMAAGLPVVATAVGGVPEAVSDRVTGLLVSPRDSTAFASALLTLAADPELRRLMGAAGLLRSKNFDIRTAVATQEDAYAVLAASARRFAKGD